MKPSAFILILTVLTVACPSCASDPKDGYSFASTHSSKIRTISVPIFENDTYRPGMERTLTEAIIKEIQRTTKWTVVSGGSADVTLSGKLRSVTDTAISTDPRTGLDQEMAVAVRVDFDLQDNRTGKDVVRRRGFQGLDTFVATKNVSERPDIGQNAAIDGLARDIVAELRESW